MDWVHYTNVKSDQCIQRERRRSMGQESSRNTQLADMWRTSRYYVVWCQSSSQN